ncbi:hypothetical protein C8J57DRAFT_1249432 [Mycena rebaudengoi]|nr:hypothetical protein C8J57DRAFT_1249432 [Mycena rebaudengoi]
MRRASCKIDDRRKGAREERTQTHSWHEKGSHDRREALPHLQKLAEARAVSRARTPHNTGRRDHERRQEISTRSRRSKKYTGSRSKGAHDAYDRSWEEKVAQHPETAWTATHASPTYREAGWRARMTPPAYTCEFHKVKWTSAWVRAERGWHESSVLAVAASKQVQMS